jgi:hypothetical protein
MEQLLWLGIIIGLIVLVYALRMAGHDMGETLNKIIGPAKPVVTPMTLQKFLDEPANQPGGYTPWVSP